MIGGGGGSGIFQVILRAILRQISVGLRAEEKESTERSRPILTLIEVVERLSRGAAFALLFKLWKRARLPSAA